MIVRDSGAKNQVLQLVAVGTLAVAGFIAARDGVFGTGGKKLAQIVADDWGAAFGRHPLQPGPASAPPAQGPGPGGNPGQGTTQTQTPQGQTGAPADGTTSGQSNVATGNVNLVPTAFVDLGGFPVVYMPQYSALIQDPTLNGTNVYGPNDVFTDTRDGQSWQFLGGTTFRSLSSGQVEPLEHFAYS